MRLGTAGAVVTPPLGSALAGYAFRDHGAESVLDALEARVFYLEERGEGAFLVTADLIGFDEALTAAVRADLSAACGVAPEAILLAASHTHSGPPTCTRLRKAGGAPDPAYTQSLRAWLVAAARDAQAGAAPAHLFLGKSSLTGYAIHRRVVTDRGTVMAPNPAGVRDDEVTALVFRDSTDRPVGVLFHYTCHPTLLGDYRISGDYPGAARRAIEKALPGVAAAFLPGCFGDIRPYCVAIGGKSFRRGGPEDVSAFGAALAEAAERAIAGARPAGVPALRGRIAGAALPIAGSAERVDLALQRLDLTDRVALLAMGGEMCVDYGRFVKTLRPGKTTLPVGYANGLVGYVSPARYFAEGGYESLDSWPYFELPGPFAPETEAHLQAALRALGG